MLSGSATSPSIAAIRLLRRVVREYVGGEPLRKASLARLHTPISATPNTCCGLAPPSALQRVTLQPLRKLTSNHRKYTLPATALPFSAPSDNPPLVPKIPPIKIDLEEVWKGFEETKRMDAEELHQLLKLLQSDADPYRRMTRTILVFDNLDLAHRTAEARQVLVDALLLCGNFSTAVQEFRILAGKTSWMGATTLTLWLRLCLLGVDDKRLRKVVDALILDFRSGDASRKTFSRDSIFLASRKVVQTTDDKRRFVVFSKLLLKYIAPTSPQLNFLIECSKAARELSANPTIEHLIDVEGFSSALCAGSKGSFIKKNESYDKIQLYLAKICIELVDFDRAMRVAANIQTEAIRNDLLETIPKDTHITQVPSQRREFPVNKQIASVSRKTREGSASNHLTTAYNNRVYLAISKGNLKLAQDLLTEMLSRQIAWDTKTYATAINLHLKVGHLSKANRLFREMAGDSKMTPDRYVYANIIDANAKRGNVDVASRLLSSMSMRGVHADIPLYNCLLGGYAKAGDEGNLERIVAEMTAKKMEPNVRSFNTVISGLSKAGCPDRAVKWSKKMVAVGIEPDAYTLNALLQVQVAKGDMAAAEEAWQQWTTSEVDRDHVSWNTLLTGWAAAGDVEQVERVLAGMKASRTPPDAITFTILISFYARCGKDMSHAEELFNAWYRANRLVRSHGKVASEPFSAMIHGFGVLHRNLTRALSYRDLMIRDDVPLSASVLTCLMQAHAAADPPSLPSILHILRRLLDRREGPSVGVEAPAACIALDSCGHAENHAFLTNTWRTLRAHESGMKITRSEWSNVYGSYVEGLLRCGRAEDAVEVLTTDMVEARIPYTDKIFYTTIAMMAERKREVDPALIEVVKGEYRKWKAGQKRRSQALLPPHLDLAVPSS